MKRLFEKVDIVSIAITIFATVLLVNTIMYGMSSDVKWLVRDIMLLVMAVVIFIGLEIVKYLIRKKP